MSNRHPADHATNLASDIIAEVHRYGYIEAVEIIAVRLRCERAKGHVEGLLDAGRQPTAHDLMAARTPAEHAADMAVVTEYGRGIAQRGYARRMERRKLLLDMVADEQADHDQAVADQEPWVAA